MESSELMLQVPGTTTAPRIEIIDPQIERRLRAYVAEQRERPLRIALDERDDVAGHATADAALVRVIVEGDDDTEGHAISIRFPNADDAQAFRAKLAAGVLVGAVVIAGAGAASNFAPSIGSTGLDAAGVTSITMPNVHADQAIAPAVGQSAPSSVHADQAIAPTSGTSAPSTVHADQAIAPAGGISAPSSVHADQALPAEAPAVPNVHSDQAMPAPAADDDDSKSRLPRGNDIR